MEKENIRTCFCPFCQKGFEVEISHSENLPSNKIRIGEISILTKNNNLEELKQISLDLLKNKSVQGYLKSYEIKNQFKRSSYTE